MEDQQSPSLLAAVIAVLGAHDPEGLVELDVPAEEYDLEAEEFVGLLTRGVEITSAVVVDVWERWFGPESGYVTHASPAEIARLAADLNALR
jgi:predicted transcriptional regulator YdeE